MELKRFKRRGKERKQENEGEIKKKGGKKRVECEGIEEKKEETDVADQMKL